MRGYGEDTTLRRKAHLRTVEEIALPNGSVLVEKTKQFPKVWGEHPESSLDGPVLAMSQGAKQVEPHSGVILDRVESPWPLVRNRGCGPFEAGLKVPGWQDSGGIHCRQCSGSHRGQLRQLTWGCGQLVVAVWVLGWCWRKLRFVSWVPRGVTLVITRRCTGSWEGVVCASKAPKAANELALEKQMDIQRLS